MADRKGPKNETPIAACAWRRGGRCFHRAKDRRREAGGNHASSGQRRPPAIPDLLGPVPQEGRGEEDPNCAVGEGSRCPFRPFFENLVLSIAGVEVKRFRCPCEQTKLLEVFHSLGWPDFIRQPFGVPSELDPKHGFRDIVYELNDNQHSPQRVYFRCDDGGVRWEIVGEAHFSQKRRRTRRRLNQ